MAGSVDGSQQGVFIMHFIRSSVALVAAATLSLWFSDAHAVPSFARQTGMDCTTCHMSWLELTNVGRRFKLGGYQLMKQMDDDAVRPLITFRFDTPPPLLPIAGMLQIAVTQTQRTNTPGVDKGADFPFQNETYIQQASLFFNGKIIDHVGCFCQLTYDGASGTTSLDNFEIRFADSKVFKNNFEAIYGLSLNNNPGMSDVWNTTPVWAWPYIGSNVAVAPIATPIINSTLAASAGGLTAYTLLGRTLYAEIGAYHTTDGALSFAPQRSSGRPLHPRRTCPVLSIRPAARLGQGPSVDRVRHVRAAAARIPAAGLHGGCGRSVRLLHRPRL